MQLHVDTPAHAFYYLFLKQNKLLVSHWATGVIKTSCHHSVSYTIIVQ